MKTQNLAAVAITAALSLTAVTMVVWQSRHRTPTAPPTITSNQPVSATTSAVTATAAAEIPVANELTSTANSPVPVTIRERCKNGVTTELDASGNVAGWLCNPSSYEDYSTEALEILAYGDAEAATVLAYRLRQTDYPRAIQMAQRSVALSGGETRALLAATNWRPLVHQNGDADLSGYGQAYVLHRLIERLKDSSYRAPPTYEKRIRQLTDEPDLVFKKLDAVVDHMYDEIRRIELDITGESTIGGDDDA